MRTRATTALITSKRHTNTAIVRTEGRHSSIAQNVRPLHTGRVLSQLNSRQSPSCMWASSAGV